jgi:hypothetical protein
MNINYVTVTYQQLHQGRAKVKYKYDGSGVVFTGQMGGKPVKAAYEAVAKKTGDVKELLCQELSKCAAFIDNCQREYEKAIVPRSAPDTEIQSPKKKKQRKAAEGTRGAIDYSSTTHGRLNRINEKAMSTKRKSTNTEESTAKQTKTRCGFQSLPTPLLTPRIVLHSDVVYTSSSEELVRQLEKLQGEVLGLERTESNSLANTDILQSELTEAREELAAVQQELKEMKEREKETEGTGFLATCKMLLPTQIYNDVASIQGVEEMGKKAGSVKAMSDRGKRNIGRVGEHLLQALATKLKAGPADPSGVTNLILQRRLFHHNHVKKVEDKQSQLSNPFAQVMVASYHAHRQLAGSDARRSARQMLSLIVVAMQQFKERDLISLLTPTAAVKAGDQVNVRVKRVGVGRPKYCEGVVLALGSGAHEGTYTIRYTGTKNRPPAYSLLSEPNVPAKYVRLVGGVYLEHTAIYLAKVHARSAFPGAIVPPPKKIRRNRITGVRAAAVLEFVMRKEHTEYAEQSAKNVKAGVKYLLKMGIKKLWRKHNTELGKGVALSWGPFLATLSENIFGRKTAQNCVCTTCRNHGVQAFDNMRAVLVLIDSLFQRVVQRPYPRGAELADRADGLEQYLETDFLANIRAGMSGSSCLTHCGNLALGAAVDVRLACPCSHDNGTSTARPLREWADVAKVTLGFTVHGEGGR